jgi:hypothetical protein
MVGMATLAVVWLAAAAPVPSESEADVLRRRLDASSQLLSTEKDAPALLKQVHSLAMQEGLTILRSNFMGAVNAETYLRHRREMEVAGPYRAVAVFVERLGRLPKVVTLSDVDLRPETEGAGRRLRMRFELATYSWSPVVVPAEAGEAVDAHLRQVLATRSVLVKKLRDVQAAHILHPLAAFDGAAVALSQARVGGASGQFEIRGWRASGAASLRTAVERIGAEDVDVEVTREGACEAFVVRGRMAPRPLDELGPDRGSYFGPASAVCGQAAPPAVVDNGMAPRSLTLDDGTRFSFELMRSAGKAAPDLVSSAVMAGKDVVHRVLADRKRTFYGYSVKATALEDNPARFRVLVGPLMQEARRKLEADFGKLMGDPLAIEYPAPQVVGADEPLLLELMINPATGEKLADVIRVSRQNPPTPPR